MRHLQDIADGALWRLSGVATEVRRSDHDASFVASGASCIDVHQSLVARFLDRGTEVVPTSDPSVPRRVAT